MVCTSLHFDYPLQIFSFISLHLISLLTLFVAAQSLSVVLEGGAPTVNSYAGKVSSDGTTLTLSGTARLYMLNANGNAYQVLILFSSLPLHSSYYVLQLFDLVNKELSYDVDTSQVGCGGNGALYFNHMNPSK